MLISFMMLFWENIITNNAVVSGKLYALPNQLPMIADNITLIQNSRPDPNRNMWGLECIPELKHKHSLKPVNIKTNIKMLLLLTLVFERCMFGPLNCKLLLLILQIVTVNFMYQLDTICGALECPAICSNIILVLSLNMFCFWKWG